MRYALSALMGLLVVVPCAGVARAEVEYRSPSSLNDCTFLKDPTALRDCIDFVEGRRVGPPIATGSGTAPVSPTLIREAGPIAKRGQSDHNRPDLREATPAVTDPVRVEQIGPGRGIRLVQ